MSNDKSKDTGEKSEMETFSIFNSNDCLLKFRDQTNNLHIFHSQILLDVQKYFTTLLSALMSIEIGLITAYFQLWKDAHPTFNNYPYLYFIFSLVPIVIIFFSWVALNNSLREYRNTMAQHSLKMKIDEILGVYNKELFQKVKSAFQLKLFPKDHALANQVWIRDNEEKYSKDNTGTENFAKIAYTKNKLNVFRYYSNVFVMFFSMGIVLLDSTFICVFFNTYHDIISWYDLRYSLIILMIIGSAFLIIKYYLFWKEEIREKEATKKSNQKKDKKENASIKRVIILGIIVICYLLPFIILFFK